MASDFASFCLALQKAEHWMLALPAVLCLRIIGFRSLPLPPRPLLLACQFSIYLLWSASLMPISLCCAVSILTCLSRNPHTFLATRLRLPARLCHFGPLRCDGCLPPPLHPSQIAPMCPTPAASVVVCCSIPALLVLFACSSGVCLQLLDIPTPLLPGPACFVATSPVCSHLSLIIGRTSTLEPPPHPARTG